MGEGVTTAYDGFGRVSSSTLAMAGTSRTIGHLYDGEGNRTRITHPDGSFLAYEYDGLNRFDRVRENGGVAVVAVTYDSAARRSGLTSGGTSSGFGYDFAGRLQSLAHELSGTSGDQTITLGYNPANQILSRGGTNDSFAWTGSVATVRPYAVNGLNQYASAGTSTFGYDPNGNLTTATSPPYTSNYVYDVENRLVSASGAQTASLVYDPLGRLFQVSGWASGATQFLYDDDALIGEYNSAGTMTARYVHGSEKGVDDPLLWYDNPSSGWRRALVSDQQGSIVAVADMYGNPVAINAYDEYGIPKFANVGRFGYTGQAWIPELGMYYYKARIYSPTLGRFLQTDPIGYEDQVNLYAYVGNDPINEVDPTGREREDQKRKADAQSPNVRVTRDGISVRVGYRIGGNHVELEGKVTSDLGVEGRASGNVGSINIRAEGSSRWNNDTRAEGSGTGSSDGIRANAALGKAEARLEVTGVRAQAETFYRAAEGAAADTGVLGAIMTVAGGIKFVAKKFGLTVDEKKE